MCTQENVDTFKEIFNRTSPNFMDTLYPHMIGEEYFSDTIDDIMKDYMNKDNISVDIDINIKPKGRNGEYPIRHMGHIFKGCGNLLINIYVKGDKKRLIANEISDHVFTNECESVMKWIQKGFFRYFGMDVNVDFADVTVKVYDDDGNSYGSRTSGYEKLHFYKYEGKSWVKVDD